MSSAVVGDVRGIRSYVLEHLGVLVSPTTTKRGRNGQEWFGFNSHRSVWVRDWFAWFPVMSADGLVCFRRLLRIESWSPPPGPGFDSLRLEVQYLDRVSAT